MRNRALRFGLGVMATVVVLSLGVGAQETAPSSRSHQEGRGRPGEERRSAGGRFGREREYRAGVVRAVVDGMRKEKPDWSDKRHEFFARLVRDAVDSMAIDKVREFEAKTLKDRAAEVITVVNRLRAERDKRFVLALPEAEQAALAQLDEGARRRRINDMRLVAETEAAIKNAQKFGLVTDEEADELRQTDAKVRFGAILALNKKVFLQAHAGELSKKQIERLSALDPRAFFDDETVKRHRLLGTLPKEEIARISKLPPAERQEILRTIGDPAAAVALVQALGKETAAAVTALDDEDRRRLVHELERFHFSDRRRFGVQDGLMRQLDEKDRAAFFAMSDEERIRFLKERFPDVDWETRFAGWRGRGKIEELMARVEPWERDRLRRLPPDELERELRGRFGVEADPAIAELRRGHAFRGGMSWVLPEVASKLSPEEMQELRAKKPGEQLLHLVDRFPEVYAERLDRAARVFKIEVPAEWPNMAPGAKARFLLEKSQRAGDLYRLLNDSRGGGRGPGNGDRRGPPRGQESRPTDPPNGVR